MRIFIMFEWIVILAFCWLFMNIIRYLFFKGGGDKGGWFGLSDSWLNSDKQRRRK